MANIDLTSVRAKVDRAAEHLKTLDGLVGVGVERDFKARAEFDPVNQGHRLIHEGLEGLEGVDLQLVGTILGDFIHNARSALDHLVCAVVRGNRVKVRRYHAYPFCVTPQQFKQEITERDPARGPSSLDGMTADQVQIVFQHQPYVGRDKRRALRSPLFSLHAAWNVDKHRAIHTGQIAFRGLPTVTVEPAGYFSILSVQPYIRAGSFLEPETPIALVQVGVRNDRPLPAGTKPNVYSHLLASVGFRGEGGLRFTYTDVRQMLRDVTWAIRGFDQSFKVPW